MPRVLPARPVFAFSTVVFWVIASLGQVSHAADNPPSAAVVDPALRHWKTAEWHVAESSNFRFFHHSQSDLVGRFATLCEESRQAIRKRWLGATQPDDKWAIKCDVYLYPTTAEYQRKTRFPAESWGFADLEIGQGRVWMRRLDLRSDNEAKLTAVGIHELTHVVLADRFAHRQIPRWADEGIALNSEPPARQQNLRGWLAAEIRQGRGYTLTQIMSMQQYPHDKYLGELFYAQSGSLIEFLLSQNSDSETGVLRIVENSLQHGVNQPLLGVPVARLEAEWKAWLMKAAAEVPEGVKVASDRP